MVLKYIFNVSFVFLLIGCIAPTALQSNSIRVLLKTVTSSDSLIFESTGGFSLWDNENPTIKMRNSSKKCKFFYKNGTLWCERKKVKPHTLCVSSHDNHITFNGKKYQGTFLLIHTGSTVLVVNCLPLEDYVFSVLKTESWPGWPLEVNKVFAIASRTYALAMIMQARKARLVYDVKNSNIHQTYSGVHQCALLKKAVEQTKGIFLAYKKQPIIAMFDSCCGGVVPAHIDHVNFIDAPYLARTYACVYCKSCSLYNWKFEYDIRFLEDHVSKIHGRIKRLRDFKITAYDKAGLVKQVDIKNGTKPLLLSRQQIYSLFKEIKSFCFKISRKGNKFFFNGKGYGHHLGLCQWGARQMVREGYDYKSILRFYYPHTDFMKL